MGSIWKRLPLVPLRVVIGVGFVMHGYAKLARGPEHFAAVVATLGLPAPTATAWLTIAIELGGGLAVLAGAFVRPVSVVLAGVLVTAIAGVHWRYGFSSVRLVELTHDGARFGPVGYELPLVYLAALAALALAEPTPGSVDDWRRRRRGAP
jgi:putative oxidoreductase